MTTPSSIMVDLAIVGGGVAGLWILNRAVAAGRSAILLERDALGAGQTICAQGIIHGGTKYTLGGALTEAAQAIAGAPARWRACLSGKGEIDLTSVNVLSDHTWMWSPGTVQGRLVALLASHALRSRAEIAGADRPAMLATDRFRGAVYRLDECVLDVRSLLHALSSPVATHLVRADVEAMTVERIDGGVRLTGEGMDVCARHVVLAAGSGYAGLARLFGLPEDLLQRRPLHMVTVRHAGGGHVYGHCIGASDKPLLTVTSHPAGTGETVWYLGGGLAEDGVARSRDEQIAAAKVLLSKALQLDRPVDGEWSTFRVDRAEPRQPGGRRPDGPFAQAFGEIIVAWPTKLALAPALADRVLDMLPQSRAPGVGLANGTPSAPAVAPYPWESSRC